MNLLAPLFLIGAALIAGPILFHLIRRQPKDKLSFSSTEFLKESPPKIKRRNRIQNPLLLLIRALVILLLCLAFARPFLLTENDLPTDLTPPRTLIVAIDQSASMGRPGIHASLKQQVLDLASSLGEYDSLSLISFAESEAELLTHSQWQSWPLDNRNAQLSTLLDSIEPLPQNAHLDSGIEAALALLDSQRETNTANDLAEIVLVSDFAEASDISGLAGLEWPLNTVLRRIQINPSSSNPNVGLRWLGWDKSENNLTTLRLGLIQSPATTSSQVTLRIENPITNASIIADRDILLDATAETVLSIEVPDSASSQPLIVKISGDNAPFDNQLSIAPEFLPSLPFALLSESPQTDPNGASYFVAKALESIETPRIRLSDTLENTSAAFIDRALSPAEQNSLLSEIENGSHTLFVLNSENQLPTLATLLNTPSETLSLEPLANSPSRIGFVDFSHPLFRPFADPRFSNFANIRIWSPLQFSFPDTVAFRQLASLDSNAPLLLEKRIGKGSLLIWISSWRTQDSQWLLSSKFVPWFYQFSIEAAGGTPLPSNAIFTAATLDRYRSRLGELPLDAPGFAALSDNGQTRWIAFHLPPEESKTTPLTPDVWDKLGLPEYSDSFVASRIQQMETNRKQENALETEHRQQLWKWLLLATLTLLAIESLVAIRIQKTSTPQPA